jgi:hypothetical protein
VVVVVSCGIESPCSDLETGNGKLKSEIDASVLTILELIVGMEAFDGGIAVQHLGQRFRGCR